MFTGSTLTVQGQALLAKIISRNLPLTLSEMAIGDGTYNGDRTLITTLVSEKIRSSVENIRVEDGCSLVRTTFSNENLVSGFYVKEVGIFAVDPDTSQDILYAYDNVGDETSLDFFAPGTGVVVVKEVFEEAITFGNASSVQLTVNPQYVFVTIDQYNQKIAQIETPSFEDYSVTTPVPTAEEAMAAFNTGVNHLTLLSKAKAFFLGALTFARLANNAVTTVAGFALDARVGKSLQDQITAQNNNFASQDVSSLFVNGYSTLNLPTILSKSGKIVVLSMYLVTIGSTSNGTKIMTLPNGYRPLNARYCDVAVTAGGALEETPYYVRLTIDIEGNVLLSHEYTHKSTNPYLMGTLVFSI